MRTVKSSSSGHRANPSWIACEFSVGQKLAATYVIVVVGDSIVCASGSWACLTTSGKLCRESLIQQSCCHEGCKVRRRPTFTTGIGGTHTGRASRDPAGCSGCTAFTTFCASCFLKPRPSCAWWSSSCRPAASGAAISAAPGLGSAACSTQPFQGQSLWNSEDA